MDILRTPDDRFASLPGYAFTPHYVEVPQAPPLQGRGWGRDGETLRLHYLDEGPRDAPVVLMLHGNPTWSFLYRHMIGPVAQAGYRVVVPDMIGFGRSDKPAARNDYSYDRFVAWMAAFLEALDLTGITLVAQDWGGPIGLRLLADHPDRFAAVFATNTLLPNREPAPAGVDGWPGEATHAWIELCRTSHDLSPAALVKGVAVTDLAEDVLAGYEAPFPSADYKAGMHQITACIPAQEGAEGLAANRAAWALLDGWDKPFGTAFSDADPSTWGWREVFLHRVPGAQGQDHPVIANAGHFVQEEAGGPLAEALLAFLRRNAR